MVQYSLLAQEVGFDGVDIKCCHRYLNCELLSAYNRPGDFGGSFENRTRFLMDCVRKVKAAVNPEFIITTVLTHMMVSHIHMALGLPQMADWNQI